MRAVPMRRYGPAHASRRPLRSLLSARAGRGAASRRVSGECKRRPNENGVVVGDGTSTGGADGANPRARSERLRSVMAQCGRAVAAVACLAAQAAPALAGPPDPAWVTSIVEEDDFWAPNNKDRHYTHGVRIAFTSPDLHSRFWQAPFDWTGSFTTAFPSRGPPPAGGKRGPRAAHIPPAAQTSATPRQPAPP